MKLIRNMWDLFNYIMCGKELLILKRINEYARNYTHPGMELVPSEKRIELRDQTKEHKDKIDIYLILNRLLGK